MSRQVFSWPPFNLGCRWRYGRLLSAYLDGELSAAVANSVASHLRECVGCRSEWEQLQFSKSVMAQFEIPASRGYGASDRVLRDEPLGPSVIKWLCYQRIAIPLPLAAGLLLSSLAAFLFVSRSYNAEPVPMASVQTAQVPPVRIVEVPVERIVTRTVYLKRANSRSPLGRKRQKNEINTQDRAGNLARISPNSVERSASTLEDFRPAASVNLRLVKEQ
jgi:Putative zinc-finger